MNGFKSDQICQIAKYAGMSDKLSCLGLFDINPNHNSSSDNLVAQIIWYFIEGVNCRIKDDDFKDDSNYQKYNVLVEDDELIFYKSIKSIGMNKIFKLINWAYYFNIMQYLLDYLTIWLIIDLFINLIQINIDEEIFIFYFIFSKH